MHSPQSPHPSLRLPQRLLDHEGLAAQRHGERFLAFEHAVQNLFPLCTPLQR
ncbi:hypothetical protein [Paraburkholderia unamae]|uniref:hypothetical protein n=1 Tax=Paraburkholderia unamae TaxID=219649 RepID=UPI0014020F62|nr:hypothetical protein [Paraburkholderia unamae]